MDLNTLIVLAFVAAGVALILWTRKQKDPSHTCDPTCVHAEPDVTESVPEAPAPETPVQEAPFAPPVPISPPVAAPVAPEAPAKKRRPRAPKKTPPQ